MRWIRKPSPAHSLVERTPNDAAFEPQVHPWRKEQNRQERQEFENSMQRRGNIHYLLVQAPFRSQRFPRHSTVESQPQRISVGFDVVRNNTRRFPIDV